MRVSTWIEEYRIRTGYYRTLPGVNHGVFVIPGPCAASLVVIAADATTKEACGWEHVNVSTKKRIPNWIEMCFVKKLFWEPEDVVVQFHPAESSYVNNHPNVLHMWRWTLGEIPTPPSILVGVKEAGLIRDPAHAREVEKQVGIIR